MSKCKKIITLLLVFFLLISVNSVKASGIDDSLLSELGQGQGEGDVKPPTGDNNDPGNDGGFTPSNPNLKNAPKLIIDSYSITPEKVKPGEEFTIEFIFYNTNDTYSARNISIHLTSEVAVSSRSQELGAVFSPVNASNTFYISRIYPGEYNSQSITLSVVPNAPSKNYTINIKAEYEDLDGNQFTAEEVVGVPVIQEAKIESSNPIVDQGFVGQESNVGIDFYNTGKDSISNLMVSIEGEGFSNVEGQNYFVGNFEPGQSDSYRAYIVPDKSGELKGNFVFSYEDSQGKKGEMKKEFSLFVDEAIEEPIENGLEEPIEEPKNNFNILFIILPIVALIVIIVVIVKRRKNKKQDDELEI